MRDIQRRWAELAILSIVVAAMGLAGCNILGSENDDDDGGDDDGGDDTTIDDDSAATDDDGDGYESKDPNEECELIEDPAANEACRNCVIQCNLARESNIDLSDGPCLSEEILEGWVCDVVHSPHEPVDDIADNQCAQWPTIAPNKVEVTPECHFVGAQ